MRFRQSLTYGVVAGILATLPLMALLYLAEQATDLPYAPFDTFNWLARTLPGDVITRGIDAMVELIHTLNLGETSSTAKTLEQLSAQVLFLALGSGAALALWVAFSRLSWAGEGSARFLPGALAGALVSVPFVLISLDQHFSTAPDEVIVLWLILAFAAWGVAVQWLYLRLTAAPDTAVTTAAPPTARAEQISRRAFLIRVGGATATLTVLGAAVARYLEYRDEQAYQDLIEKRRAAVLPQGLPNEDADLEPAPGTRPEYTPLEDHYRIDISVRPMEIDGDAWRLAIGGLVATPLELTLDDIRSKYEAQDQFVTLACISNPVGGDLTSTTRWTGVPLQDVLAEAGLDERATHIKITSADGFYETVALDLINSDRRIMLTYNWDGIPLLYEHGFPLRIYIPDRYGMKQPKWITDIEVMDRDEEGYWVVRGWDRVAQMRATSVVDVAASDHTFERDGVTYVPVGGIAHAGARGISKVEVQVDDGGWVEAQLRTPLSSTTWVIWRYDWPFEAGQHTFAVRCYEGDGTPQSGEVRRPHPSGASGIHSLTRTV